ncbi:carboxymethylenebutenolidase [Rhodanobacter glycinis]|uniref:Carboxymethylenebutenolidase n=2 Tax=Rhodanobacter glycinis TaxID=582702 RepID=A0A1I4C152_9GAMM|nr:carboxymethylenebutenolidase [Rhodanobacter glycinis]
MPSTASKNMIKHETINIRTPDGQCATHVFTPEGTGPWPAVIVYMDAFGIRPGLMQMGEHIAASGYVVLVPDLFYRYGAYGPLDPKEVFASGGFRAVVGPLMASTDNVKAAQDTEALLAYLDTRKDVAGDVIGTVGFCMGGGMAIAAAGTYPDRVAAAVSFHGGRLATDDPVSPHLLAPKIRAELYVAVADNDGSSPPDMVERFEQALDDAGVRYRCELYRGASHGWMKPDFPVYDEAAAKRGWSEMFALFDRVLKQERPDAA